MRITLLLLAGLLISRTSMAQDQPTPRKFNIGFFGGLAIPVSDFAAKDYYNVKAGGANLGFAFGAELGVPIAPVLSWWSSAMFSFNGLSEDYIKSAFGNSGSVSGNLGTWTTIWPVTGLRFTTVVSPTISLSLSGQVGIVFGTSPDVNATQGGSSTTSPSVSASAFAYGLGAGLIFGERVNVTARYFTGQPSYKLKITTVESGPGFTSTYETEGTFDIPASIFQLLVGVIL
ncbi:MAG: hypothetical protein HYY49_06620 [Ignavibacteriales bacterium]|nr:hypothetical protein [Ignavibacteriales bacterium]